MKNPIPSLLVDNLRHIHDHGLAVEFTAPKLVTLLTYLRAKQGVTELKAGQSTLRVTTLGNVTKTEAFWSVGSYYRAAIHYYETATGLKFTLSRETDQGHESAYNTLNSVIFGEELKKADFFWKIHSGAEADKLNQWLKKFRWCITGSNGLRGQALSARFVQLEETKRAAASVHGAAEARFRGYNEDATPEFFRKKHAEARETVAHKLAKVDQRLADWQTAKIKAFNATAEELFSEFSYSLGLLRGYTDRIVHFPEAKAVYSHPIQSANYAATVDASGGISLSSGIRCEFTAPQVLQWLRGETSAPSSSRYGKLERCEVSTPSGAPSVLLKCGCHWIDAANVSAEFRELLRPAHTVTQTVGKPRADFCTPEFADRLSDKFAEKIAAENTLRADYIREFADRRAYLTKEETDLPATIADLRAKADAAKTALDAAEKAIADAKNVSPLGADADTLAALARLFLSSQSFHPSL